MLIPIRDHNPSQKRAYVTYGLILTNLIVFAGYYHLFEAPRLLMGFFSDWGMLPARLMSGHGFETLVTHQFLHGGVMHLGSNLLFLWIFGDNVEEALGHWRFLGFYLICGVAAAGLQFMADPYSMIPMVGASGAIAGVLGAYLLLYPRARVDMFLFLIIIFRIIPIPAWLVLGSWFGMQILGGISAPTDEGGVAYWAHAGGFLAGLALIFPAWRRLGGPQYWAKFDGHPPHPEATYALTSSNIPKSGKFARFNPSPWKRKG